jgi:hypothetical protein
LRAGAISRSPPSCIRFARSTALAGGLPQEGKYLMSELQGPRIPGEEGSGRGRRLAWIIAGLIALLLLALLIPFACQALTGDPARRGAPPERRRTSQPRAAPATRPAVGKAAPGARTTTARGKSLRRRRAQMPRPRKRTARRMQGPRRDRTGLAGTGPAVGRRTSPCRRPAGHPWSCSRPGRAWS